jgi:hypothetical protein
VPDFFCLLRDKITRASPTSHGATSAYWHKLAAASILIKGENLKAILDFAMIASIKTGLSDMDGLSFS